MSDEDGRHNPIPKSFKTRRSEIISGLSVAGLIGVYGVIRNIVQDINELIEAKGRATDQRIEREFRAIKDVLDIERVTRKEDIGELKQRIIWIERELRK